MKISGEDAVSLLNSGRVIAMPTETVYGLAASILFPKAIEEIFRLKGRPQNNPLIVHLGTTDEISLYTKELPADFHKLATAFWPGPLTLILAANESTIPDIARAGLPTAGFRIPAHALTREVLKQTGPLVMPSANLSGRPSATTAAHVEEDFGSGFSVLDGGECEKGMESTILCWDHEAWAIIRLGAYPPEDFLPVLGYIPSVKNGTKNNKRPLCPGQLYKHYSPAAKLILFQTIPEYASEAIVGFSDRTYPKGSRLFSLGNSKDPQKATHELYALLRRLDHEGIDQAYVDMDFPEDGLWLTLRERLLKAAHS